MNHAQVMQRNRDRRVATVTNDVLLTADAVAALGEAHFDASGITRLIAPHSADLLPETDQAAFVRKFRSSMPMIDEVMTALRHPNLVLCGGSVASCFSTRPMPAGSDYDFFVVGIDPGDKMALWAAANHFTNAVTGPESESTVTLAYGVLTVKTAAGVKLQLILRSYPTIASVVHAFDINACSMAFDGSRVLLTEAAAFGLWTRTILVDPALRSTTYEKRLIKYAQRGYALGFPNLQLGPDMKGRTVSLPFFDLCVKTIKGGLEAVGEILLREAQPKSDYDVRDELDAALLQDYVLRKNVWAVHRGDDTGHVFIAPTREFWMFMGTVTEQGFCSLKDVIDMPAAMRLLKRSIDLHGLLTSRDMHKVKSLERVFGMTKPAQLGIINRLVMADHLCLDISSALNDLGDRALAKLHSQRDKPLAFWITADPGRQWTASLNPAVASPDQYYGEYYCEAPAPVSVTVREMGSCPMCFECLYEGDVNTVVLACGHPLHFAQTPECAGSLAWFKLNETCPTCRRGIVSWTETRAPRPAVRLTLDDLQ